MPLYKKKPCSLLDNPTDLSPDELVFQVRYTNEIFRDYSEYLNRINLYRQRFWSCKVTGKSNLSFEEALLSERDAIAKVQQFPSDLIAPVLQEVQFSMLNLKDLISKIVAKVQNCMLVGSESYGRKNNRTYPCKIIKVLREEAGKTQYQVAWLDGDNKATSNAVVDGDDLIKKKLPFSRDVLKSFIRESTYRSLPWVLHDKLAQKHGISTIPPKDVVAILSVQNGCVANRKRKRKDENNPDNMERSKQTLMDCKRKHHATEVDKKHDEPKYPIDDLLVHPSAEDSELAQCPKPSSNFIIPMDCVGDCLMVWDFCSSFGRLLKLSPFSFDEFQNALCHKDSSVDLILETHSALLRLLIKDSGEYLLATQRKKRKQKITFDNWVEYLCDFLEMVGTAEFSGYVSNIKRGHYGLLDVGAKLGILRELVARVLATELYREKLDEYIEERQALAATNREESLAEGRKKRKDKVSKVLSNGMQESDGMQASEGHKAGFDGSNSIEVVTCNDNQQTGATDHSEPALNESKKEDSKMEKDVLDTKVDGEVVVGSKIYSSKKGVQKVVSNDNKGVNGEISLKQRVTVDSFLKYYQKLESRPLFGTVEEMLKWAGLYNLTTRTLQDELVDAGLSSLLIQELATVITRINYGQSVSMSGLAGAVSLAGSGGGLWAIEGGNWQMAAGLINRSDVALHMREEIESISYIGNDYELNSTRGNSYRCNVTVVATPLDELNISFSPEISIPERKLQHTHATFVRGLWNPAYFGFNDASDLPELVGTIESSDLPFTCISILKKHNEKDMTYKMFSRQPLTDVLLDQIFSVRNETIRINWGAYPHYHSPEKFAPFILDDIHLYYVNAFENAASTMETSAVAAENIARLIISRSSNKSSPISSDHLSSSSTRSDLHSDL